MANTDPKKSSALTLKCFTLRPIATYVRVAMAGSMSMLPVAHLQAGQNLPVPSAVWASMGKATSSVVGNHMQIDQQTDKAILNWESFNIGKDHSVNFKQPGSTSIALNKIFQNDPSRILGTLSANGQVYLVNSNGIVFGKNSKVDVRGLVASTLDVSDSVFEQGVTKVFANNGSAAFTGKGDIYQRNADGSFKLDASGNKLKTEIVVEEGAELRAKEGQNILIIAPSITNKGHIEADERQVVLAAATDKVYLQEAGNDGLLVEVQTGGDVNNLGSIAAKRGNVNLVGFAVNQQGKVSASTSLNINGKIRLIAREGAKSFQTADGYALQASKTTRVADNGDGLGSSAKVTLGPKSQTEILPELNDGLSAIDEQVQPKSQVDIMGHTVHFQSGSAVTVPGGKVNVVATENPSNPLQPSTNRNASRIQVESGAKIDVSGVDSTVKRMEDNVVEVELRLNQLKDSPLQRNGILFGKTILVDSRVGTPIADVKPSIDGIKRPLGERLAKGGEINLNSEGDTIIKKGAELDFSGGAVKYADGYITTTKLTANGRIYDISEAHPSLTYDAIYGKVVQKQKKWGVEQVWDTEGPFALARKESGYTQGFDAGSLNIKSPNVILEGQLNGGTVTGRYQRTLAERPLGGSLNIDMRAAAEVDQAVVITGALNKQTVDVDIQQPFPQAGLNTAVSLTLQTKSLSQSGIMNTTVLANGEVDMVADSKLKLADGGSLTLQGGAINIAGEIKGLGAALDLATDLNAKTQGKLSGDITISKGAKVDLQGGWVNDMLTPFKKLEQTPITLDGGKFVARANGNIDLQKGSSINVSAGARLKTTGEVQAGNAGSVHLHAVAENTGSNITLDGLLAAYALGHGGLLELEANAINIRRRREDEPEGLRPLQLEGEFFSQGGFADYLLTSNINGLVVDEGVSIKLQQINRILDGSAMLRPSTDSIAGFSKLGTLPAINRQPSSLTLQSVHTVNPNANSLLQFKQNAGITADTLSTVSLVSDSSLYFDGSIAARGGNVSLQIIPPKGLPSVDPLFQPTQGIWLGDHASVDVSGIAVTNIDAFGLKTGEVYDGGIVNLTAARGFIATQAGSEINVSGTLGYLNRSRLNAGGGGVNYDPVKIGSNGGSVNVTAAEGIFLDGRMQANGGNVSGTSGGSLNIRLDNTIRVVPVEEGIIPNFPKAPGVVQVSQENTQPLAGGVNQAGDALPVNLQRKAFVSAGQVSGAGFASLSLQADSEVRLLGDVELNLQRSLQVDAPILGWQGLNSTDTGRVVFNAAHASLGSSRTRTAAGSPSNGNGQLVINADLIELYGGSYTTGFKQVDLNADSDIRLRGIRNLFTQRDYVGEFLTYGMLHMDADQLYPTTLSQFKLAVKGDNNGDISLSGGTESRPVLSAYSKLTIDAPVIGQNGIIKAPLGEISLTASKTIKFGANSVTSVSAEGQIIPFGLTEGGLEWLYPIGNQNLIVAAPQKSISIKADEILRDEGATLDLSGGGDLQAYEFIPGVGGSVDVLASNTSFAVVPGFAGYAPYDPLETPKSGLAIGDSVYLGAGSGLAAGNYTLLPAHYALLPGAYLVTPQSGTRHTLAGSQSSNLDGASVVAGYQRVMGTDIKQQYWSGFAVEPGTIALTRSQLNLTQGNKFFADQALKNGQPLPRLPEDAGSLKFDAKTQLDLPVVRAEAANGGLAGFTDVIAENIAVVNNKSGATGVVELLSNDLENFSVGSLLLGGVRTVDSDTGVIKLAVKSKTVRILEDTKLEGAETILAATDSIELKSGAQVVATGEKPASEASPTLSMTGDGALLRVSKGAQAQIDRTGPQGLKGDLSINGNAKVVAETGSVALDSTRNMSVQGDLIAGAALNIGANTINIGELDGSSRSGLSLDNAQLSRLISNEVVLSSRGNVNIYGGLYLTDASGNPMLDEAQHPLPVNFKQLAITAQGISGFNNAGKIAAISAETLTIKNLNPANQSLKGNGSGQLSVNAKQMELAGGDFTLSGFSNIQFNLGQSLTGSANSKLQALGDVAINTGYISGETGSQTTIDASGYQLSITKTNDIALPVNTGIAAQLNLSGNAVSIDAPLLFKGGSVSAEAKTGDVLLKDKALIDVSGVVVKAGLSAPVLLPAGHIRLTSLQKDVSADAGSRLWLNGAVPGLSAGSLDLSAKGGQVKLNGAIDAHAGAAATGGQIAIDTGSLSDNGFSDLNQIFTEAGFTGAIDLRLRNADLTVKQQDTVTAQAIQLTADQGKLTVAGKLDAHGEHGGAITLNASNTLTVTSTANLNATATGEAGDGGRVKLNSAGGIAIQNGALINVSANGGQEGDVHLRAERLANSVNVAPISTGTILGDSAVTIEALARYNLSTLDAAAINTIKNDTAAYMGAVSANPVFAQGYQIMPGIEVSATGNLTLAATWNLVDWRYGLANAPGYLTLKAGQDLVLQNSLTDAFKDGVINVAPGVSGSITDMLQTGPSWTYTLIAGADSHSANPVATLSGSNLAFGDIKIGNNVTVRTGTGNIDLHAGRDIVYGNDKSVVYTAGRPDEANRFGLPLARVASSFYVEYPIDGGDISFQAGRDIKGAVTNQIVSDWLLRTGNWSNNQSHTNERPTAWGIALGTRVGSNVVPDYRQNVGALGGGNINISAGGTVSDLSVVIPTTGKQVGQRVAPDDPNNQNYLTNEVEVNGGGNLQLTAGGDLKGGMYYVDGGIASLNVVGSLTAGAFKTASVDKMNPILAMGDAKFQVTAGKDLAVQAIIDPMILPQPANKKPDMAAIFFRYGNASEVSLTSLAGSIQLGNDISGVIEVLNNQRTNSISFAGSARDALSIAPASVKAYALNGDVAFKDSMLLFPSASGQFELFAGKDIVTASNGNTINITMSDSNPKLLPSVLNPAANYTDANLRLVLSGISNEPDKIYAPVPNHINDLQAVLISTAAGDIFGKDPFQFIFPKQAQVFAGNDIRNVSFQFQHNFEGAGSIISAGRDIKFDIARSPATGALINLVQRVELAGPGRLTVMAGRNVDLGSSAGISTSGNQINTALAEDGAAIDVLAGLAQTKFAVADYMGRYLGNRDGLIDTYVQAVSGYMRRQTGDDALSKEAALEAFNMLSASEQSHFNASYLLNIIKPFNALMTEQGKKFSSAKNSFDNTNDDAARFKFKQAMDLSQFEVLAAIETLFPGSTVLSGSDAYTIDPVQGLVFKDGQDASSILSKAFSTDRQKLQTGDISMFFSKIHSTDGGDINLLTPNGGINAGLAVNSNGAKDASQLGVVAIKQGAIHSIVRDNFQVNTTRVMTLGGGDISIGSTEGDIDAGRGAKTALAAPAPIIRFDNKGNLIVELPAAVAGSGIRANEAPDGTQGDALLFALLGKIDASEAGVGGKDITVGATAIVGSDNIDVGGVSVGVPAASAGVLAAGLGNVSNVAASISQAVDSTSDVTKTTNEKLANTAALAVISVDILGFGEEEN